jgi:cytochrome b pre-mRNA-processing protein 3
MPLFSLFRERPERTVALALYGAIVAQSRRPDYYSLWGVPDTLDGRFDLLVLHASLAMRRLKAAGGTAAKVSQALFDIMFEDLDHSLREMGVGDITVPKRIKEMGEAFYGRAVAYDAALSQADTAALKEALVRNIYRGTSHPGVPMLAAYTQRAYAHMQGQKIEDLCDGRVQFPELELAD